MVDANLAAAVGDWNRSGADQFIAESSATSLSTRACFAATERGAKAALVPLAGLRSWAMLRPTIDTWQDYLRDPSLRCCRYPIMRPFHCRPALSWIVAHAVYAPGPIPYRRLQGALVLYLNPTFALSLSPD
jgi:hypothetical protein